MRTIHFTVEGIDIVDSQGEAFRQNRQVNAAPLLATFPKSSLRGRFQGGDLFDLWKAVRTHLGQVFEAPTAAATITQYPFQKKDGLKYPTRAPRGETPTQNRPPRQEDALWLLDTFLNERFPDGGTFRTISKSIKLDSTEDHQAFLAFLQRPQYSGHPWAPDLLAALSRGDMAIYFKSLPPLRGCHHESFRWRFSARSQTNEMQYHLGPPGSALPPVLPPPKAPRKSRAKQQTKTYDKKRKAEGVIGSNTSTTTKKKNQVES